LPEDAKSERRKKRPAADSVKRPTKLKRKDFRKAACAAPGRAGETAVVVRHKGLKVVVIFEGRDAAGKGGVIKRITDRVSPRIFRVVALPAPTKREK
jgi:polyphosphate kinase